LEPAKQEYPSPVEPKNADINSYFPRSKSPKSKSPIFQGLQKAALIDHNELPFKILMFEDGMFYGDTVHHLHEGSTSAPDFHHYKPNYGLFWYTSGCVYVGEFNIYIPEGYGYFYTQWGVQYYG
jgi:hypothetical protein